MLKNAHGRLLLIRADGGPQIGFGHVMRSMAVAEEWLARGGRCVWATNQPRALDAAGSGRDDIKVAAMSEDAGGVADARATRQLAESSDADWVLADLHVFSPAYFSSAGSRGARWVIAHDEPLQVNERIHAILNPGPHATPGLYSGRDAKCGLMLGLDYALVRGELHVGDSRLRARPRPPANVLITFGGSDPGDLTWRSLCALSGEAVRSDVRFRVVLGPGYRGQCAERGADFPGLSIELVRYTSNMGGHYSWADLIVCGASTTLWEAFYFGLPAVVMPAAPNQPLVFDALAGCAAVRGCEKPDAEFGRLMSAIVSGGESDWLAGAGDAALQLVDGNGAARVADFLLAQK